MIVITKGKKKLTVTNSAYENFYKNAGWKVADKAASVKEESPEVPSKEEEDEDEADEMEDEEDWDAEVEEEDAEPTKPLSEMNRAELEQLAKELDVSLAGLSTNKQIREAIKAAM